MILTAHFHQPDNDVFVLTFSRVWILTPNLTFPILPAPSVFCNCQSPTILYLDLLLEAPFDDADGADDLEA
jgi:hypothetical protein